MTTRGVTVPIADKKYLKKRSKSVPVADDAGDYQLSDDEVKEQKEIDHIIDARKRYEQDRKMKEREWTESYKMYMSWVDRTLNPYLSNLFIPKTHEAVELLSAFLIGTNQSVGATPENGDGNVQKAQVAGKWLDYLWRKVLKARLKILVWIKQGIVFGNGVMNFGWDADKKQPWMNVCAIEDVYFDYFEPDVQDSEYLIYEVRRTLDAVKNDDKYDLKDSQGNLIRGQAIVGGMAFSQQPKALFNTYDGSFNREENKGKVLVLEVWCLGENGGKQFLKTLLPTSGGWRMARRSENPNHYKNGEQFRPFSKLKFKTSPVPNRAYETGAVFPTVKIQKAFNDLMNEYFDSVVLVNAPMWIKRRGSRINPQELVRRPGGVVTVGNINTDLKSESVTDVKQSIIEMLNRLDREFQEASMVVNLLKGMGGSDTATGDALGQQNVQTLLDMINQNIVDALSEAGQMIFAIAANNYAGSKQSLELYQNDKEVGTLEFDPANIDGMHDIVIQPDRSAGQSKDILAKQIIDFLNVLATDPNVPMAFPKLKEKLYRYWLEKKGISSGDIDNFFQQDTPVQTPTANPALPSPDGLPAPKKQNSATGNTIPNITSSILKGADMVK